MQDIQKLYAMVLGAVLALVGLLGFFMTSPLFGLFGTNALHNVVHLVSGALGLWLCYKGSGRMFNQYFGIFYAAVAVLGFIPFTGDLLTSFLGVDSADNILHAAIGLVSLGVGYGVKE